MNDIGSVQPQAALHERRSPAAAATAARRREVRDELADGRRARRLYWTLALALLLLFWLTQYTYVTTMRLIQGAPDAIAAMGPRVIVSGCGLLISIGIVAVQRALRHRSLGFRAIAALAFALVGSALHSMINFRVFSFFFPDQVGSSDTLIEYASMLFEPFWLYTALSAIALAFNYGTDIRERERHIERLQALANAAQLRALRNQLNPHFLFNTLNSITALISRGRSREAEQMTESLADFLRQTLVLDPQRQITLGEEIALQLLYLDIEKARFPDRLNLKIDIPAGLETALVPSLITQPLIENSVKYAVARSSEQVDLEVRATAATGRLELVISDNGGNASAPAPKGVRVGLANVAERLRVDFGAAASLDAAPRPDGGFRNVIRLPLRLAGH